LIGLEVYVLRPVKKEEQTIVNKNRSISSTKIKPRFILSRKNIVWEVFSKNFLLNQVFSSVFKKAFKQLSGF